MKLAILAFALAAATACGGAKKKAPEGPLPDDIPQEVTCCMQVEDGMDKREVMPVERCPEELRNSVDACDIGPGDAEPTN